MAKRMKRIHSGCALLIITLSLGGCLWAEDPPEAVTPNVGVDTPQNPENEEGSGVTQPGEESAVPPSDEGAIPPPPVPEEPLEPEIPSEPAPDPYDPVPEEDSGEPPSEPEEEPDDGYEDDEYPLDVRLQGGDGLLRAWVNPANGETRISRFPARLVGSADVSATDFALNAQGCVSVRDQINRYRRLADAGDPSAPLAYLEIRGRPRATLSVSSHTDLTKSRLEPLILAEARSAGLDLTRVNLPDPLISAKMNYVYDFMPGALAPLLGEEDALMRETVGSLTRHGLLINGAAAAELVAADLACDLAMGRVKLSLGIALRQGARLRVDLASVGGRGIQMPVDNPPSI